MSQETEQKNNNSKDAVTEKMAAVSGDEQKSKNVDMESSSQKMNTPQESEAQELSDSSEGKGEESESNDSESDAQASSEFVGDETKSNKRLSAETLFAFALPAAVQKKLQDEAISQASSAKSAKQDSKDAPPAAKAQEPAKTQKPAKTQEPSKAAEAKTPSSSTNTAQVEHRKGSSKAVSYVLAGLLFASVIYASFYLLDHSEFIPANTNDFSQEKSLSDSESAVSPVSVEAVLNNEKAQVPAGALEPQVVAKLSDSELVYSLTDDRPADTLLLLIKEAATRNKPSTTSALIKLNSHSSYLVRVAVVRALVDPNLNTTQFDDYVLAVLDEGLEDSDELVRGYAAKAYAVRGGAAALPTLKQRLSTEESPIVKRILKSSIEKLSSAS